MWRYAIASQMGQGLSPGMSRSPIKGKFDEIMDFAEMERFWDTPVKRYPSEMKVWLAFAVAAHRIFGI